MKKNDMPKWANDLDKWGKQFNYNWNKNHRNKKGEYIGAIVINLILILIWERLIDWLPFLTDSFVAVLPLFYLSFGATIIVNLLLLIYDARLINGLLKAGLNIISIIVMLTLYYVFPFDFSAYTKANWELIIKILLIVGIFGTVIGTLIEFIRALFGQEN